MYSKKVLLLLIILFSLLGSSVVVAQGKIFLSGAINDKGNNGLEGANIILYPLDKSKPPSFAISKESGKYSIDIIENTEYTLNITFIGFVPIKQVLISQEENIIKNFVLEESTEELEEIVLNYTPAIEVKKDTTTFRTDTFVNGKERKLGAVLKKLPGVSVNRDGEVFFKDKKVQAVLVENKTFFTGQPKMATQNIPADVVSEVQMIEDYNETAFLKEFDNSDNLVMNIKLKEGKKEFFFGDIELAGGYQDRYRVHPSIFKYSPNVIHNFIGDLNNAQSRSFSLSDYINIEGEKKPKSILEIISSPMGKFLQNEDYFKNEHLFGGYNFQYNPNEKSELRVFTLGMLDKTFKQDIYNYTYQASQAFERRLKDQNNRNSILFGKIKYKFTPDIYTILKIDFSYNKSQLDSEGLNFSETIIEQRDYSKSNELVNDRLSLNLSVDKWFSNRNVSTAKLSLFMNKESLFDSWRSDTNIFTPDLPLVNSNLYLVNDRGERKYTDFDFDLKHHFRPIRTNMISFGLYGKIYRNNLKNLASQITDDFNSIDLDGFENNFESVLTEINNSITHKWYINNDVVFDVGVVLQNIFWKDFQFLSDTNYQDTKLLPVGKIEWNFDEKKSVKLSYNISTTNPEPVSRMLGRDLDDFNRILIGSTVLTQPVSERALLSISLYKTYGLSFYFKLGYRKHKNPIIHGISFDGINGIVSPLQPENDITSYDITLRTKYNRRYWRLTLVNGFYQRKGFSFFNETQRFNHSLNINNTLEFSTTFEEVPNIELDLRNSFLEYKNPLFTNRTFSTDIDFSVVYDYKNWKFDFSAFQNFYNNRTQNNKSYFNLIEAKVFYRKEDSPIELGMEIYNLGNNTNQISNTYNTILFAEKSKRLFPRTIMLNINYKL